MRRLSLAKQVRILTLFHNLFASGFTLSQIVSFLKRSALMEEGMVVQMEEGLKSGRKLSDLIGELGFSDMVVTQLDLADHYGKLADCMGILKDYSQRLLALKKKLIEVGTYPLILLSFLALIMMGLKNYLLPQLEEDNLAPAGDSGN